MTKVTDWGGSPICNVTTISNKNIDQTRFTQHSLGPSPNYAIVADKDILGWGSDHSVYVKSKSWPGNTASSTNIVHVPAPGEPIEDNKTVQYVIDVTGAAQGPPTHRYTRIVYSVTLQNNLGGYAGGTIMKNGQTSSSAWGFSLYPGANTITIKAIDQPHNGLNYAFTHWSNSVNGTTWSSREIVVSPTSLITYFANFVGTPQPVNSVSYVSGIGEPIRIEWDQHPNSSVQYKVWRWVKDVHDWQVIGTVSYGTTTFTDNAYTRTATYSHDLLSHGVSVYYPPSQTESQRTTAGAVYGQILFKNGEEGLPEFDPRKHALNSYPNPFDGRATIEYVLPETESVRLVVYDVQGRRVRMLVEREQGAGPQAAIWDGTSDTGAEAAAGIYLLRLETRNGYGSRQMTLIR